MARKTASLFFLTLVFLGLSLADLVAQPIIPTTPYTRYVLTSPDAATARFRLGVTSGGGTNSNFGTQFDVSAAGVNLATGLSTTNQNLAGAPTLGTVNLGSISGAINVNASAASEFNALLSGNTIVTFTNVPDYHPWNFTFTNAGDFSVSFAYATPIYWLPAGNSNQPPNDLGAGVINRYPFWRTGGRLTSDGKVGLGDVSNVKVCCGAKGDGVTDDTAALTTAMLRGTNTVVYFPPGVYPVTITSTNQYAALFRLRSGMKIIGDDATILVNADGIGTGWSTVFGVNTNEPVVNASITGINFVRAGTNTISAISPDPGADKTTNCVENLRISNCTFYGFGSAVYAIFKWNGPAGTEFRPVNGITIENCTAKECFGSFVTADQANITIQNNTAVGCLTNSALAFDAISVHSGQRVKILNNFISDYGSGEGINIRNSVENHSGTKEILVSGNLIWNITNRAGISISAVAGEANWGINDVTVSGNKIWNTLNGIYVDTGSNIDPFSHITIIGNTLTNRLGKGILMITPIGAPITHVLVADNQVHMGGPNTYGMQLGGPFFGTVSGNTIICDGTGSSRALQADNLYYMNVVGNSFLAFSGDPIGSFVDTSTASMFVGNAFYGLVTATNIDALSFFSANKTPQGFTLNGVARGVFHDHVGSVDIDDTLHVSNNTGLGTTSPYEKLEVAGAIAATGVTSATAAQGPAAILQFQTGVGKLTSVDWGVGYKPLTLEANGINFSIGSGTLSTNFAIDATGFVSYNKPIVWNGSTNSVFDLAGNGSPEGVKTAAPGSIYRRLEGGAATSVYVKESGTGNTGWVGVGAGGTNSIPLPVSVPNGGTGTNGFGTVATGNIPFMDLSTGRMDSDDSEFVYDKLTKIFMLARSTPNPGVQQMMIFETNGVVPILQFYKNKIEELNDDLSIDAASSSNILLKVSGVTRAQVSAQGLQVPSLTQVQHNLGTIAGGGTITLNVATNLYRANLSGSTFTVNLPTPPDTTNGYYQEIMWTNSSGGTQVGSFQVATVPIALVREELVASGGAATLVSTVTNGAAGAGTMQFWALAGAWVRAANRGDALSLSGGSAVMSGTVSNNVVSNGLAALDGTKTNVIAPTLAMMTNAFGLTGDTTKYLNGAGVLSSVAASNIVSGGQLPIGTLAPTNGASFQLLGFDGTERIWETVGPGLTNTGNTTIQAALSPGTNTVFTTNGNTIEINSYGVRTLFFQNAISNNVTTGETIVFSNTLPAGTLSAAGSHLRIFGTLTNALNANTKTIKLYLGTTVFANSAAHSFNTTPGKIIFTAMISRGSTASINVSGASFGSPSASYYDSVNNGTENLATDLPMKLTLTSNTASDDLSLNMLTVEVVP